eukprot:5808980-Prorocentrum_lima.AAC.1
MLHGDDGAAVSDAGSEQLETSPSVGRDYGVDGGELVGGAGSTRGEDAAPEDDAAYLFGSVGGAEDAVVGVGEEEEERVMRSLPLSYPEAPM